MIINHFAYFTQNRFVLTSSNFNLSTLIHFQIMDSITSQLNTCLPVDQHAETFDSGNSSTRNVSLLSIPASMVITSALTPSKNRDKQSKSVDTIFRTFSDSALALYLKFFRLESDTVPVGKSVASLRKWRISLLVPHVRSLLENSDSVLCSVLSGPLSFLISAVTLPLEARGLRYPGVEFLYSYITKLTVKDSSEHFGVCLSTAGVELCNIAGRDLHSVYLDVPDTTRRSVFHDYFSADVREYTHNKSFTSFNQTLNLDFLSEPSALEEKRSCSTPSSSPASKRRAVSTVSSLKPSVLASSLALEVPSEGDAKIFKAATFFRGGWGDGRHSHMPSITIQAPSPLPAALSSVPELPVAGVQTDVVPAKSVRSVGTQVSFDELAFVEASIEILSFNNNSADESSSAGDLDLPDSLGEF